MAKPKPVHEAFEECLELVFQGESIEDCLRRFPAQAAGLRPLLETVVATRKAVVVDPRPEFREQARQRLLAAQRDRTVKTKGRRTGLAWNWRPAWALSLAAFLVVVAGGGGTVAASGGSMPGQPLYAVKHAAESARLAPHPGRPRPRSISTPAWPTSGWGRSSTWRAAVRPDRCRG